MEAVRIYWQRMTPKKILIGVLVMLFVMGFIVLYKWNDRNTIPNQKTINEHNSVNLHDDIAVLNSVKKHDDSAVLNSVKKHDDSAVLNSVKKHDDIAVLNSVKKHDDIAVHNSVNIHDDIAVLNSVKKHDDIAVLNSVKKHDDIAVHNSVKKHDDIAVLNSVKKHDDIAVLNSVKKHDDIAVLNSVKKHDDIAVLNSVKKHDDSAVLNSVKKHDDIAVQNSVNIHDDIAVYLRMTTAKELFPRLYESVVVRSISYFWPELASLFVVLDAERSEDHVFGGTIQKSFPYPRVCYMEPITDVKLSGYDRMQRDMFYPEKCTSKKLVGFIDTDTIFIARVIPEVLFEDGKPIIIAVYETTPDWTWDLAARSTAAIFKTKEVMKCMTYFPVIFKVEHIIAVRNYLEKLHNMSIENILHTKQSGFFSQFNLMCHYVWTFHRHEYKFYFQHKHFPTSQSKGRVDASYYKKYILPEHTHPFPRISDHYKYHNIYGNWKNQDTFRKLLKAGICYAGGFERCSEKCKPFKKDSLRKEMFIFDHNDWTWDTRCISAQRKYYDETSKYDTPEYREVIQKACDEVDTLTLRLP